MKKEELDRRTQDYKSAYIKKTDAPAARLGKSLYIREEHHKRISHIVHIVGQGKITLYEYVDNVLNEHFKEYHEEIVNSFIDKRIY
ncbi:DUF3408 domain-containing protein [Viscerimonas tarda]|nr:hypothetical protein FACS189426_13980 [Bacteroidia bacterium]GHU83197.1 hypothetical protein FACS189415_5040 [Bacteroidia bacterium]GHV10270.1 hypothetical protein FACS1894162_3470 [Bacteroidia bacterium]GHV71339.1 hypothetical protein FACS189420_6080 [Bacteroidia bacterium]